MSTRFDNQRVAVGKLIEKSETVNIVHAAIMAHIREDQLLLGYGPGMMTALVLNACEKAVGGVSDDSDPLRDNLPSRVSEYKSIGWAIRVLVGESSVEEISSNTHSTDAETVQQAVDAATHHVFDESEVIVTV